MIFPEDSLPTRTDRVLGDAPSSLNDVMVVASVPFDVLLDGDLLIVV